MEYSNDEYPNSSGLYLEMCTRSDVPSLLQIFINSLVLNDLKTVYIAQTLTQASRSRTYIMTLMLYLAVQLDHMYGSEQLLQYLSRLGFCSSVDEVARYKQPVMQQHSVSLTYVGSGDGAPIFAQFATDNVDHNVHTLDGYDTFHGMEIITGPPTDSVVDGIICSLVSIVVCRRRL